MLFSDFKDREVINIRDCRRLGKVTNFGGCGSLGALNNTLQASSYIVSKSLLKV